MWKNNNKGNVRKYTQCSSKSEIKAAQALSKPASRPQSLHSNIITSLHHHHSSRSMSDRIAFFLHAFPRRCTLWEKKRDGEEAQGQKINKLRITKLLRSPFDRIRRAQSGPNQFSRAAVSGDAPRTDLDAQMP